LQKLVPEPPVSSSLPAPSPANYSAKETAPKRFSKWIGAASKPQKELLLLPEGKLPSLDEQIETAADAREAAAASIHRLLCFCWPTVSNLSPFERDTLLLCAAQEFDPSLGQLCAEAQGCQSRNFPTFSLALTLFDDPRWGCNVGTQDRFAMRV
jgi:hypothetical protein